MSAPAFFDRWRNIAISLIYPEKNEGAPGIFPIAFAGLRSIIRRRRGTMKHLYSSLVLACLLASTLWAADDPFLGKWKLNMEKSKFTGEQTKIEDLGGSKYK